MFYIISAEKNETFGTDQREQLMRTEELAQLLQGTDASMVQGMYNETKENSFLIRGDQMTIREIRALLKAFDQDCGLFVLDDKAFYIYQSCIVFQGSWVEVKANQLAPSKGYTKIGDRYFTIK